MPKNAIFDLVQRIGCLVLIGFLWTFQITWTGLKSQPIFNIVWSVAYVIFIQSLWNVQINMTGIKYLTSWKLGHTALLTLELHALDCWHVGSQVSDHCPLGFLSENSKLCLDSRLKGGMDLIANGSVTLDIWKFKVFVFWLKWAASWQNRQNDCAPSNDSAQPGYLPSLIRVFALL